MNGHTTDVWGGLAFRGVIAIVFGAAAVFWPGLTLKALVYLFAGFILAMGVATIVGSLTNLYNPGASMPNRALVLVLGLVETGVGVYLLRHPEVSFATFILIISFTLIFHGIVDIFVGLFEQTGALQRTVIVIAGLLAVIAGLLIINQPVSAGVTFVWILGLYALITGPLMIALAVELRRVAHAAKK